MMNLCFATYAFDTILSKLTNQNLSSIRPIKYQGTTAQNIITDHLKKTLLSLEVEFGNSTLSFSQLIKLKIGDVMILDKKIGDEVRVSVEKKHMFNGVTGVANNHKAVKITNRVDKRKN